MTTVERDLGIPSWCCAHTADLGQQVAALLPKIGNIVAKDVPTSDDEEKDNEIVSTYGPTPKGDRYMHHHEVRSPASHRANEARPQHRFRTTARCCSIVRDSVQEAIISNRCVSRIERRWEHQTRFVGVPTYRMSNSCERHSTLLLLQLQQYFGFPESAHSVLWPSLHFPPAAIRQIRRQFPP